MGERIISGISVLLFFLLLPVRIHSQMKADSVDIATYNMAINGKWEDMMKLARQSLYSGTDFHYLRLRMGIYYYNKGNFRRAAFHFFKAYKMYASDDLNNEYLYYACLWGSRANDSYYYGNSFSNELKKKINYKEKYLDYLFSDVTFTKNFSNTQADFLQKQQLLVSGYQIVGNMFYNVSAGAGHRISRGTTLHWAYYRLMKYDYLYTTYGGIYNFYNNYNTLQNHYYLSINQCIGNGFNVTLSGNYVNTVVNGIPTYGSGNRPRFNKETPDTVINAVSVSASLSKDISMITVSLLSNYSNFSGGVQLTQTASVTCYPFGNLNLYLSYIPSYHYQKNTEESQTLIHAGLIGYKIFRYLWNELYFSYGKIQNYSSYYSYYIYNDSNPVNYIVSSNFIIPLQKIKIFLRYSLMSYESYFHAITYNNLNEYNKIKYVINNFTGGFVWHF